MADYDVPILHIVNDQCIKIGTIITISVLLDTVKNHREQLD
jgi:hypothetical protein